MTRFFLLFLLAIFLNPVNVILGTSQFVFAAENQTLHLSIPNMRCGNCEETIRNRLNAIPGVKRVDAKHRDKSVRVEFDPGVVTQEKIIETLRGLGFTVKLPEKSKL